MNAQLASSKNWPCHCLWELLFKATQHSIRVFPFPGFPNRAFCTKDSKNEVFFWKHYVLSFNDSGVVRDFVIGFFLVFKCLMNEFLENAYHPQGKAATTNVCLLSFLSNWVFLVLQQYCLGIQHQILSSLVQRRQTFSCIILPTLTYFYLRTIECSCEPRFLPGSSLQWTLEQFIIIHWIYFIFSNCSTFKAVFSSLPVHSLYYSFPHSNNRPAESRE